MSRWIPWLLVAALLVLATAVGLNDSRSRGGTPNVSVSSDESAPSATVDTVDTVDTDGDGILDFEETNGWTTAAGVMYTTDPREADSDGDGLPDGQEAGAKDVVPTRGSVYAGITNPISADSDGDDLDDASELDGGFNPWADDSDGDGLDDMAEVEFGSDPLTANADGDHLNDAEELAEGSDPNTYDLTGGEASGAFAGGAMAGDFAWLARNVGRLSDEQLDSGQYLAGQAVGGVLPLADARDIATNVVTGEWGAAMVSLVALVPVLGDSGKVTAAAVRFAKRGGAASRAASYFIAKNGALSGSVKSRIIRSIVRVDPAKARLSQDAKVWGSPAPAALGLNRPIGRTAVQNTRKDELVEQLTDRGYTEIRVNQQQVDAMGLRVGINRPDIQATAPDGTREFWELDTNSSSRGPMHEARIVSNDEDAGKVCLLSERTDYVTCDN